MNPVYAALCAAVALASTPDHSRRGRLVSALSSMTRANPLDFRLISMDAMRILAQAANESLHQRHKRVNPSWIGIWRLVQHQLQTATQEVCFAPSWEGIDLTPLRDANNAVTAIVNLGQSWEG